MRSTARLSLACLALALLAACATTQVQKARQVSVDVHATLAAIQDAENQLYASQSVPQWTPEKHQQFNAALVVALKAGRAFNEGVRTAPDAAAGTNLAVVSGQIQQLSQIVQDTLPLSSPVVAAINIAKDAVLQVLPIFFPAPVA